MESHFVEMDRENNLRAHRWSIAPIQLVAETKKERKHIVKTRIQTAFLALLIGFMGISCLGQGSGKYPDPERFSKEIQRFKTEDKQQTPPRNAIVCIGSSSMRGWHGTIHTDLAPLTIIPRGFGGSNMKDALHFADRIVLPYRPRAIVLYEGDNDIAQGIAPEKIAGTFRAFVGKVHADLPECRIYFLSIKPSIQRWSLWPKMKEANHLVAMECRKDKRLVFIDVASGMLDGEGNPRRGLFKEDKLHMTRAGYVIWRNVLRPILAKAELRFEPKKDGDATERK